MYQAYRTEFISLYRISKLFLKGRNNYNVNTVSINFPINILTLLKFQPIINVLCFNEGIYELKFFIPKETLIQRTFGKFCRVKNIVKYCQSCKRENARLTVKRISLTNSLISISEHNFSVNSFQLINKLKCFILHKKLNLM